MSKRVITIKNNYDIKEKILGLLKTSEIGASSTDIAKSIGHNRITISKYLEVLQAQGLVKPQDVAQAKLWKLVDNAANKPSVLLVDDEPHVVKYLTIFFEDNGYETCSAADGEEALEVLRRERPDLVTLDLQMPNETGTRFYRNMTKDKEFKDTPVIVISGIPGRHLAVSKHVAVFEKPIDRDALLAATRQTIGE